MSTQTPLTAAYCSGALGPGKIQTHVADVTGSGLTTVILWALHIGRPDVTGQAYGDLIFNDGDDLFISAGAFNPLGSPDIAAWPAQVASLLQPGSGVTDIWFSIGGANPPVYDFTTIEYMLEHGMAATLLHNFAALKQAFTVDGRCVIRGFDLDSEESVKPETIVTFCAILFGLGFEVTFCPYTNLTFWQGCMQTLWEAGHKVSWWNLQCYAGGNVNRGDLTPWLEALGAVVGKAAAPSYLVPGLAVSGSEGDGQCPTGAGSMGETFAGWSSLGLAGGFLWNYDSIPQATKPCAGVTLADYVTAVAEGLRGACV